MCNKKRRFERIDLGLFCANGLKIFCANENAFARKFAIMSATCKRKVLSMRKTMRFELRMPPVADATRGRLLAFARSPNTPPPAFSRVR